MQKVHPSEVLDLTAYEKIREGFLEEMIEKKRPRRIHVGDAYRILYVAKFKEGVYILHAFQKKTQKASKKDLDRGRQRYKEMILHREAQKG